MIFLTMLKSKHMERYIVLIIAFFSYSIAFGQQDPEAKIILDKLSEKTKSHKTISANFKVSFKNIKENIQNSSEGIIVLKGNKYRLNFMSTESFYDGKTLWNYLPEENEVNITDPDPDDEDIFNNPRKLFTIYENNYKYQLINNFTDNSTNYSLIDLYPMDINEDYSRIRLQINTDQYFLSSATVFGKDGSHYTISIDNYKINKKVNDEYFVFDEGKYPNVEIIDMRF